MPRPDGAKHAYLACIVHGYTAHMVKASVSAFETGCRVLPTQPLEYISSRHLFASMYDDHGLKLPFSAWSVSGDSSLVDEHVLGCLGPLPTVQGSGGGRGPRLALADGDALGPDPQDNSESIDHDTGVIEPSVLTADHAEMLEQPAVVFELDAALEHEAPSLHDPTSLIEDALEDVKSNFPIPQEVPTVATLAASEPTPIQVQKFEVALPVWIQNFRMAMQCAYEVDRQRSGRIRLPPVSFNTSILLCQLGEGLLSAKFVHWVKSFHLQGGSKALVGREVLEKDGKLVFSVGNRFPAINFKSKVHQDGVPYTLIIADAGVAMEQVRARERPAIPPTSLRLLWLCNVAIGMQASADSRTDALCFLCGDAASLAAPVFPCAICGQSAHKHCLKDFKEWGWENMCDGVVDLSAVRFCHSFKMRHAMRVACFSLSLGISV